MLLVNLEDYAGNKTRQIEMPETTPIAKLIPGLVSALGYPVTDPGGRTITFHLSSKGRQLEDDATLQSAGVQGGDTIYLVPEMTAG